MRKWIRTLALLLAAVTLLGLVPAACADYTTYVYDGLWNGVRAMWAPGANLHRTPYNARNHEYASEDPVLTSWVVDGICRSALRYQLSHATMCF